MSFSVCRCVKTGLRGQASKGPHGESPRAIVTMCPYSVPPSAIIR